MKVKEAMLQIHYYQYELPVLIIMKLFSYIYIHFIYTGIALLLLHLMYCVVQVFQPFYELITGGYFK
jgi:hypothetical protein